MVKTMAKIGMIGAGTVSYTHLDVYKRQVAFWYQQKPGKLPFELPADAEMVMK